MKQKSQSGQKTLLQFDVVTLFPGFFESPLNESIMKRAQAENQVQIDVHNLRDYTHDRHKTADDKPFGGGPGMVLKPEPIFECIETIQKKDNAEQEGFVILMDPQGVPLTQNLSLELTNKKRLILIAGHYEGIDQRVKDQLVDLEVSVGDFVTMGGEAPALCLMESVIRLIPGVLGNGDSIKQESFQSGLLEYPQYTRPREYRHMNVPDVLVSGNHQEVAQWRLEMAKKVTKEKRPDLKRCEK